MNEQQLNSTVKWFIGDHYGSKFVRKSHLKSYTYDMFSRFLKILMIVFINYQNTLVFEAQLVYVLLSNCLKNDQNSRFVFRCTLSIKNQIIFIPNVQSVRRFPIKLMKQQGKQVVYRKSSINQGDSYNVQNKQVHSFVTFQKVQKSTISSGKRI